MRWFLALLVACGHSEAVQPQTPSDHGDHSPSAGLASDDDWVPTYGKPELERALIGERGLEAKAEKALADLEAAGDSSTSEPMRVAVADLAVRRRFIAALEACQQRDRNCPPRLDEPAWSYDYDSSAPPPLDAPLRFDLASWQKLATELHGRACACRTIACVDGVGVAIDELEKRPMADVQGDEVASQSITRARQCLFRLRGKS